jgi:putative spermidine/putrescine transport system ATP-binding protein
MQYEIKHIHESIGVTVVYVTHDQTEASNYV